MELLTILYNQIEADIFISYLSAHGVKADAFSDNARGIEPQLTSLHGVQIYVASTQLAKAKILLEEFNAKDHSIDESFDPNQ